MITTKTINNQNAVINAILGTDDNSITTVNGNLLIQDSNGNSTTIMPSSITTTSSSNSTIITPSSITTPSLYSLNTLLGSSLTVLGISNFNNAINVNNNTITLTDGTITNTLNKSDWTGTIKTVNTTANATHFLNFSDGAGTGQGNPRKNALLTCNPSTGNITATSFNGALFGTAANASNILTISDNTAGTYFIPFIKTTANASTALFVDDVTGPLFYNPSNSSLSCGTFNGDLQYSSTTNSSSFSSGILTISCGTYSIRNFNFSFTGTTNIITGLTTTSPRNNGVYRVALQNNGTGNLTINTGLGANIKTTYPTNIIVLPNGSALTTINVITLNATQTTIVDVKVLT